MIHFIYINGLNTKEWNDKLYPIL